MARGTSKRWSKLPRFSAASSASSVAASARRRAGPSRSRSPGSTSLIRASSHPRADVCSRDVKALRPIRRGSQIRQYTDEPVPDEVVDGLLELARWTGSSRNGQPWHFIVVRDRETLKKLSSMRPNINWAATAPVGIVIAMDGATGTQGAYD